MIMLTTKINKRIVIIACMLLCVWQTYAQTYTISGPTSVNAGETYTYSVSPGIISGYTWSGYYGTVNSSTTYSASVTWNCGMTGGTIYIRNGGQTVAYLNVTINQTPTLYGGTISPASQTINYNTSPVQLTGTLASGGNCSSGSYSYSWYTSTNGSTYTAISGATAQNYSSAPVTATTYFKRRVLRGTAEAYSNVATVSVYPQLVAGSISPAAQNINYNGAAGTLTVSGMSGGNGTYTYQWEGSATSPTTGFSNISGATASTYSPGTLTGSMYYRVRVTSNGISVTTASVAVNVYPQLSVGGITPAAVTINYNTSPGTLTCSTPAGGTGSYTYQWYSSTDNNSYAAISGAVSQSYTPDKLLQTMYYKVTVTSNGVTVTSALSVVTVNNPYGVPAAANITGNANSDMNWIKSTGYDATGNIISQGKQFFDYNGSLIQSQSKVFYRKNDNTVYNHVFGSQPIRDAYGRNGVTTMAAPIDYSDFNYMSGFVQAAGGAVYNYKNFDRYKPAASETDKTNSPDPVGNQTVKGTLAWYYSSNNTWEPYTPTTSYPYSRQTYYSDGTGSVKKSAGAGEVYKMGTGHEISSYITPVINELDDYIRIRNKFFSSSSLGVLPATLQNQAIQMISRDVNGKEGILIQDKGGRKLFTARAGTELVVNNSVSVPASGIHYFKLFAPAAVTISSTGFTIMDMNTEQPVSISSGSNLAAGYYKIVNTGTAAITLTYSNKYADVSYSFYNQLGQLVATIAPEGVRKLYGAGLNNYATINDVPFIILFEYNVKGQLINTTSTDGGTGEFVYRKDGKIRFSQNGEQKNSGRYSYTNYDVIGRPIESGEYQPDASGIAFTGDMSVSSAMKNILENTSAAGGLTSGTKTDVIMTLYDAGDNGHGQSGYTQDADYLDGTVSMTRKYSSIVNNTPNSANMVSSTWYSYDEEGKVSWMIQYIKDLGYKATDYTYDVLGRLIKKIFQKNVAAETFVHYYEYDAATQNLWKVYTNTTDNAGTRLLQATCIYYLHGPLKRIELAGNLQGVDYTYTLQGTLKAINNSDKTKDPGSDGINGFSADAFGMVLDYYANDYVNNRTDGVEPVKGVSTTGITDSYAGNIKAMTWFSRKPASIIASNPGIEDATTYVYQYDDKYQFTESSWGTGINFANTPATFTTTGYNKETIKNPVTGTPAYDANGNILYLQRTNTGGTIADKFTYNYLNTTTGTGSATNYNTNKLQSVVNDATGTAVTYASYTYNKLGQLTMENPGGATAKYIKYDVTGKVVMVARDSAFTQKVVEYVYDETGKRIIKKSYNASYQLSQVTYYTGEVIYTQPVTGGTPGAIAVQEYEIQGGSGRLGVYYKPANVYAYELSDHLGNVRAVVAKSGSTMEVRMYTDYYPYGMVIRQGGTNDYRYEYQGQYAEKDKETNWNAFELRMYDSRIARWLQYDPKGEFWSPYVGMGNDPVKNTDPDGGETKTTIVDKNNKVLHVVNDGKTDIVKLDFVDYKTWSGYIKVNGSGIFERWMHLGNKISDHTLFWFDFMNTNDGDGSFMLPAYGQSLYNTLPNVDPAMTGEQYVELLNTNFHIESLMLPEKAALAKLAYESRNGAQYDIKESLGMDRYSGVRWDKNTVTSLRIAGNILFGKNMESARSLLSIRTMFYIETMRVVGLYNQGRNSGNGYNPGWPFFHEHTLSGNAIYYGYWGEKFNP
jgi:RHS repeat-associated protein